MRDNDPAKDTVFRKTIESYLEKFDASADFSAESDAVMKDFYQNNVTDQSKKMLFSDNYADMARILSVLSEKIPDAGLSRMDHLQKVYMFFVSVFSRTLVMDPFEIRESMVHRFAYMPEDLVVDCTAASLAFICLSSEKISDHILGRLALMELTEENAIKNKSLESKYLDDPQYGLVPDKPVFINGFGPHHIYLDALCTADGIELKNHRRGSMQVEGIDGPVDVYDLYLPSGKKYKTIYLCLYGNSNSTAAPLGLAFRQQD